MPAGRNARLMSDYDWMVEQLARLEPLFPPGTANGYMCYTFGWIIAECVRRTQSEASPLRPVRPPGEICEPLRIDNLWVGIPAQLEARLARLVNAPNRPLSPDSPIFAAIPPQVATKEEIFGRSDVRRACVPGANGIMSAPRWSTVGSSRARVENTRDLRERHLEGRLA